MGMIAAFVGKCHLERASQTWLPKATMPVTYWLAMSTTTAHMATTAADMHAKTTATHTD